jgi:predicted nucleic acid-binding Zn ribbon protein
MRSLASLLKKDFFKKNQQKKIEADEKMIFFIFKKIIQKEFGIVGCEKFLPQHFSNKTIFIKSISPAWSAEMWMNEERIVTKINQELGEKLVEKIKTK